MLHFTLLQRSKIVAAPGCSAEIAEVLKDGGYKKPFVIFDKGVKDVGIADKILTVLKNNNIDYVTFEDVVPDPPAEMVNKAAENCKSNGCDCVITIGGGSAIDTGKGVSVLRFNSGSILDYADPTKPMNLCPGHISIPTTAGTGAELSNGIIITDTATATKVPIVGDKAMCEYVLLDPELTMGMPAGLTIMTGLDVFSHAMEAYTTVLAGPMTDILCEALMQNVVEYLPRAVADGKDLKARQRMLDCASMGGWMLANCCAHVGHSLAHVIGAKFHIPHGAACAYCVPATIRFISPAVPEKMRKVGEILGVRFDGSEDSAQIAQKTADAYVAFREGLKLKALSEFNIPKEEALKLKSDVANETFAQFCPRKVTEADAERLLSEVFQ